MRAYLFLLGYTAFSVSESEGGALFELFRSCELSPKGLVRDEKRQEIHFYCTRATARRLSEEAVRAGLSLHVRAEGGLPVLLSRLPRRPGLLCGALLGVVLLVAASFFVWDVQVYGNERVPTQEIEQALELAGLSKGKFLPALDTDDAAAALRQGDTRIAYVAVQRRGTVLRVQIREAEPQPREVVRTPANLVAKCDAVIVLPLIYEGECLVREGEVVRAGQILAGGLMDTDNNGYRVTRAAGQVIARTVHTYTVYVPFTYQGKVYTGEKKHEISLLFFNFSGKVFQNTGNMDRECDIIENKKWFSVGAGKRLPFGFVHQTHLAYEWQTVTRTATEARELAQIELEERLAADSAGRTLLSKTVETQVDATGITLLCTIVCEEDIANVAEIELPPA